MSDNINIFGRIGRIFTATGNHQQLRMGNNGDLVVGQNKGKYAEAAEQGEIFIASTAVAGVAPGTALSTTPPMVIHNPDGSGVLVSILRVAIGYVSGTLGAGSLVYARNTQEAAPTTGTELTPVASKLGTSVGKAKAYQGSTVDTTPTIIRPSGIILGASLASTAALPVHMRDDVDGEIVLPEQQIFAVQGVAAAGSSPLIMISVAWQEIPRS